LRNVTLAGVMLTSRLRYDAVVIGAGVAGLTAAARLAEGGARVCVVAAGVGSTHLAPATVDVLGYDPDRVEEPERALPGFVAANPQHPYALLGVDSIRTALEWFADRIARHSPGDYRYVGGLQRNFLLPTAVGVARPSAMVPETMAAGELRDRSSIRLVGFRVLRDFHASLCAANVALLGIEARAVELDIDVEGRPEANAVGLARRFDDPAFRTEFAAQLGPSLSEERVGLPAVLGLRDGHGAWSDLQRRLGRPVFEIPTLPPSAPGIRMFNALRATLRAAGGRLVLGSRVIGPERDRKRVTALRAEASGHEVLYEADSVVLATGGFASGGIAMDSRWQTRETVLDLPLRGAPSAGRPRFDPQYLAQQPLGATGVAVDASLRPEGTENVVVAGAALGGTHAWRQGCGEGVSLASGYRAAELLLGAPETTAVA
jgi:glycerol-3-phosphate dehydrogenase subunit B